MTGVFSPSGREETEAQGIFSYLRSLPHRSVQVLLPVAARSDSLHVLLAVALLPVTVFLYLIFGPTHLGYTLQLSLISH